MVVCRIGVLRGEHECLSIGIRVNGIHGRETWGMRRRVWKSRKGGDIRERVLRSRVGVTKQVGPKMFLREMREGGASPRVIEKARKEDRMGEAKMSVCAAEASECLEAAARLRWLALSRQKSVEAGEAEAGGAGAAKSAG